MSRCVYVDVWILEWFLGFGGVQGSKVQRFKGSRVQGFKGSKVQGSGSRFGLDQ
jgi:hypothetical protein